MRRWAWLMVVASVGLCGAKKPKKKKKKEPRTAMVKTVAAPVFPMAVDEAVVEAVPLSGSRDGLDIQAMQRSRTVYSFNLVADYLADLAPQAPDAVLKTLAAHPDWRVHEGPWGVRAALRVSRTVSPSGYHFDGDSAWGVFVRGDDHTAGSPWLDSAIIPEFDAGSGRAKTPGLQVVSGDFKGRWTSAFRVEGDGLAFDVHEVGDATSRVHTEEGMAILDRALDIAVTNADLVQAQGVRGMYLPGGEPAASGKVQISSPGDGLIDVQARVAPPTWGWTWIRLVGPDGPWQDAAVGQGTREMVGADDGGFFYLQGQVEVPSGASFEGTAEVWFAEERGATPVKLDAVSITVPAR